MKSVYILYVLLTIVSVLLYLILCKIDTLLKKYSSTAYIQRSHFFYPMDVFQAEDQEGEENTIVDESIAEIKKNMKFIDNSD